MFSKRCLETPINTKASTANLADDSSKSSKSGRHVTREERSEDEEEYGNDAYCTDGFVNKRQLNMNVAHFTTPGDDESDGDGNVDGSAGNSYVYKESSDDADAKSTGSSIDSRYPIVYSAYMINASDENGKRSDREDRSDDDEQDDASVESHNYSADKMMMCEVCNRMIRKDMYPVFHDYRYTSGDDSEGGAKAHDPKFVVSHVLHLLRS